MRDYSEVEFEWVIIETLEGSKRAPKRQAVVQVVPTFAAADPILTALTLEGRKAYAIQRVKA